MANDLETLRRRLREQLFDVDDETWNAGEKDELLKQAVRRLNQRLPRPLDPEGTNQNIDLVSEDYYYDLNADILEVHRVMYLDSDDNQWGYLPSGWEVVGDTLTGNAKIHVSPTIVENGGSIRIVGTGHYALSSDDDSQTDAIPDEYIPLVMAWARAEAWRRLLSDRARFTQWQVANQTQNVSVNELVQMINDADNQANEEWSLLKRWQKPVPGRI